MTTTATTNSYTLTALKSLSATEIQSIINVNKITYDKDIQKFIKWIKKDTQTKNKEYVKLLKDITNINNIEMTKAKTKIMKIKIKTEQPAPEEQPEEQPETEEQPAPETEPILKTEEEIEIEQMEIMIKKMKDKKKALEHAKFLKENPPPKPAKEQLKEFIITYNFNEEDTIKFNELLEKLAEPQGKKNGIEKDPERNLKHKSRDKTAEFLCPYCKFKRMNIKSMIEHTQGEKCKRQIDAIEEDKEIIINDMKNYNDKLAKSETNYMNFLFKF